MRSRKHNATRRKERPIPRSGPCNNKKFIRKARAYASSATYIGRQARTPPWMSAVRCVYPPTLDAMRPAHPERHDMCTAQCTKQS